MTNLRIKIALIIIRFVSKLLSKKEPEITIPEIQITPEPEEPTKPDIKPEPVITPRERLYSVATFYIGKEASPKDIADDELACMESVDEIVKQTFGTYINGRKDRVSVSTLDGYRILSTNPYFKKVTTPLSGDIILSPSGYGNGKLSNGHIGIIHNVGIMSNNSYGKDKGKWTINFTLSKWKDYYQKKGGFPIVFFRRI